MKAYDAARRIHLFFGLFLLVFFMRYGVSAIPMAHNQFFQKIYKGHKDWTLRENRPYSITVPDGADLNPIGRKILEDVGLQGAFGIYRFNRNQLAVFRFNFWKTIRLTYSIDEKRLVIEDKTFRWDHFITQFHWRGGYLQDSFLHDAWGGMVDGVAIGILVWVVTGLFMWWRRPRERLWGSIALGGGFLSFAVFVIAL